MRNTRTFLNSESFFLNCGHVREFVTHSIIFWIIYFIRFGFMLFLSFVCYAFVRVYLFVPCGHLLGKGWPFGSSLLCLFVSL